MQLQPTAIGEATFLDHFFETATLDYECDKEHCGFSSDVFKMPPSTTRRKTELTAVEEITFDPSARQEYLTGFHKRKLERAKHAREVAEKQARAEKLEARKKVGG